MSVILSEAKNPGIFSHRLSFQMRGFFPEFTLSGQSETLCCAQGDSEGLRITGGDLFFDE